MTSWTITSREKRDILVRPTGAYNGVNHVRLERPIAAETQITMQHANGELETIKIEEKMKQRVEVNVIWMGIALDTPFQMMIIRPMMASVIFMFLKAPTHRKAGSLIQNPTMIFHLPLGKLKSTASKKRL